MRYRLAIVTEGNKDSAMGVWEIVRLVLKSLEDRKAAGVQVLRPVATGSKSRLIKKLEAHIQLCLRNREAGGILIVFDADDDCAKTVAANIAQKARGLKVPVPVAAVAAVREFESWLIASMDSIEGRQVGGLVVMRSGSRPDPESITDPKEWLSQHFQSTKSNPVARYRPTTHAREMSRYVDVGLATRRSRSFRRLVNAVEQVVRHMGQNYVSP